MADDNGLLTWPQWSKIDHVGLARFVTPQANRWLPSPVNRFDLGETPDRHTSIVKGIYEALSQRNIRYELEEPHPSEVLQAIRPPPAILVAPREGTCLDLAAVFCGLCLANELLPILVVLKRHAFAAVSLTHGIRSWNRSRPGRMLFQTRPLEDAEPLRALIDEGNFLAVECTGFARSEALGEGDTPEAQRRTNGLLTFEQAVAAGRRQFDRADRPLSFAIDIAVAHYGWRIEPHPLVALPGAWATSIFRLLSEAPSPLAHYLKVLDFERLVEERTRNFVGRDYVFRAIDDLAKSPDFRSGYILIRGEPGIGKTALLSQLVKTRGYVHHFNIALQNIRSTHSFLENVCAQLIIRYQLDHRTLPSETTKDSAFLNQLLNEAAKKADDQPVIILVDALDEAEDVGLSASANRLYLPREVPDGVFFIVSSREQIDYRLEVARSEDIYLRDDDPQNIDDVRRYVRGFIDSHESEMLQRLKPWKVEVDDFIELIADKSQGNFMYLVHVLEDIKVGRLSSETVDRVDKLPKGLRAYYQRHWRIMRKQDRRRFERIYEPVLRLLATVREPVPVAAIEEWTKIEPARIREVIEDWRPFLNEVRSEADEPEFRIYHTSFQDFLAQEGMGLKPFHNMIAETALRKIPGFFAKP